MAARDKRGLIREPSRLVNATRRGADAARSGGDRSGLLLHAPFFRV